ncbi:hypothetical protein D9M71_449700 [compost metagenome]
MIHEYSYEQGDMVDFDYQAVKGYGEICGCASIAQPVIGRHYIVKVYQAEGIDENVYPFQCISIPEHAFQLRR